MFGWGWGLWETNQDLQRRPYTAQLAQKRNLLHLKHRYRILFMSDFRTALEGWIRSGLDERVCEAFEFCFRPPLEQKAKFIQKLDNWMIFEQLCRYGLTQSVEHYMNHVLVEGEQLLWAIEMCAQNNSPSLFVFLDNPKFCTTEIAQSLYENHPLLWLKVRMHFSDEIQKQALAFARKQLTVHPIQVLEWENITSTTSLDDLIAALPHEPIASWALAGNCFKVFQAAVKSPTFDWKAVGQELLQWPTRYKKGDHKTQDACFAVVGNQREKDYRGTMGGMQWILENHFNTHRAFGLRILVNRFGEKDTLKLCRSLGNSLIWKIEQNPSVLDGLSKIADTLHKNNIQSLSASDICYSILPYTSRSYRSGLNSVLRKHAKETLQSRLKNRRSVMQNEIHPQPSKSL